MGKDCSLQSLYISAIHGGHAGGASLWMGEVRIKQERLSVVITISILFSMTIVVIMFSITITVIMFQIIYARASSF